jgi:hypothetical protein
VVTTLNLSKSCYSAFHLSWHVAIAWEHFLKEWQQRQLLLLNPSGPVWRQRNNQMRKTIHRGSAWICHGMSREVLDSVTGLFLEMPIQSRILKRGAQSSLKVLMTQLPMLRFDRSGPFNIFAIHFIKSSHQTRDLSGQCLQLGVVCEGSSSQVL